MVVQNGQAHVRACGGVARCTKIDIEGQINEGRELNQVENRSSINASHNGVFLTKILIFSH